MPGCLFRSTKAASTRYQQNKRLRKINIHTHVCPLKDKKEIFPSCPLADEQDFLHSLHYSFKKPWPINAPGLQWQHFDLKIPFTYGTWRILPIMKEIANVLQVDLLRHECNCCAFQHPTEPWGEKLESPAGHYLTLEAATPEALSPRSK